MIHIVDAKVYSMSGEIAHQIEYSDGTKVRAVESKDRFIRKECKVGDEWKPVGKPYVVAKNRQRSAERIKKITRDFLN